MSETTADRAKAIRMLREHRTRYQERERIIEFLEQRLRDIRSWKIDEMRQLAAEFRKMGTNINHVNKWLDAEDADEPK